MRSLLTLKALTYRPTGGIVAAPTTSLPEQLGGVRNWDYRYCWLRDATFTLYAMHDGRLRATRPGDWREWLLRAVAGDPRELQIMYGLAGERRLPELEIEWLPGYEDRARCGSATRASRQFQLDVYGEVCDALHQARRARACSREATRGRWSPLLEFLESAWQQPDEGIWEVRGPRQHFTHSKVMAWVAVDRAVKASSGSGSTGRSIAGGAAGRDPRRDLPRGVRRRARLLRPVLRIEAAGRQPAMMPLVGFLRR